MAKDFILEKADRYAHEVYKLSGKLPRDEIFGLSSQLKRAAVSVLLNIVEGYGRQSSKSEASFLRIAYGSLKESQYLIKFAIDENLIVENEALVTIDLGHELARLIWSKSKTLTIKA